MKMSKAIVYIHSFYPYEDANTVASMPLIEQLAKDFDVKIIAFDSSGTLIESDCGNLKVHWFHKDGIFVSKAVQWRWLTMSNLPFIKKCICVAKKVIGRLILCIAPPNDYRILKKNIREADLVVSISSPIWSHFCVYEVKKHRTYDNIKWIAVFQDPYAGYIGNKGVAKELYQRMGKVLKRTTAVCLCQEFLDSNAKKVLNQLGCRYYILPATSLNEKQACCVEMDYNTDNEKELINCLYVGSLQDERIRDPEGAFKLFSYCEESLQITLVVNKFNDHCKKRMMSYGLQEKKNISILGRMTHDDCIKKICQSDILINIGNTVPNQLPSKIVEYISFGKPIVHFTSTDEDPVVKLLRKYPLSLVISNDEIIKYTRESTEQFVNFCFENKGKRIDFNTIKSLYPEFTVKSRQAIFKDSYTETL